MVSLRRALSATALSKAARAKSPCSLKKSVADFTSAKLLRAAEASSKLLRPYSAASWLSASTPLAATFEEATSASTLPRVRSANSSTIFAERSTAALVRSLTSPNTVLNCSAAKRPASTPSRVCLVMVFTPSILVLPALTGFCVFLAAGLRAGFGFAVRAGFAAFRAAFTRLAAAFRGAGRFALGALASAFAGAGSAFGSGFVSTGAAAAANLSAVSAASFTTVSSATYALPVFDVAVQQISDGRAVFKRFLCAAANGSVGAHEQHVPSPAGADRQARDTSPPPLELGDQ